MFDKGSSKGITSFTSLVNNKQAYDRIIKPIKSMHWLIYTSVRDRPEQTVTTFKLDKQWKPTLICCNGLGENEGRLLTCNRNSDTTHTALVHMSP